jgi:hypothetical protein
LIFLIYFRHVRSFCSPVKSVGLFLCTVESRLVGYSRSVYFRREGVPRIQHLSRPIRSALSMAPCLPEGSPAYWATRHNRPCCPILSWCNTSGGNITSVPSDILPMDPLLCLEALSQHSLLAQERDGAYRHLSLSASPQSSLETAASHHRTNSDTAPSVAKSGLSTRHPPASSNHT